MFQIFLRYEFLCITKPKARIFRDASTQKMARKYTSVFSFNKIATVINHDQVWKRWNTVRHLQSEIWKSRTPSFNFFMSRWTGEGVVRAILHYFDGIWEMVILQGAAVFYNGNITGGGSFFTMEIYTAMSTRQHLRIYGSSSRLRESSTWKSTDCQLSGVAL